jgi:Tol biopolymer transport system component
MLPDDPYWVYFPRWSPVGDQIFFVSSAGIRSSSENINNLWLINSDGSGVTQITQDLEVIAGGIPSWSPNGEWIAVTGFRRYEEEERNLDLWLVGANVTELKRLSYTLDSDELRPNWSPDGKQLLFQRGTPGGDESTWSLWVMNLYNGSETELASSSMRDIVILPQPTYTETTLHYQRKSSDCLLLTAYYLSRRLSCPFNLFYPGL